MSCPQLTNALPRISARRGQVVDLNVDFYHNGTLADPFAIRSIDIYKTQVLPHNLVATIPVVDPTDPIYPAPVCQEFEAVPDPLCGTEPAESEVPIVGKYHLPYLIPEDSPVPDIYFDVWNYYAANPVTEGTDPTSIELDDDPAHTAQLLRCCHRFWVYPDDWLCDDKLQAIKFAFEPLDQRFYSPEKRPLEVGIIPLPLYDYNFNLVNPLIPMLRPTITIESRHCELLVENAACRIGIRQGSYRSHPWVVQYDLDTTRFLRGTYQYSITLHLPDGSTRVSRKFIITVA